MYGYSGRAALGMVGGVYPGYGTGGDPGGYLGGLYRDPPDTLPGPIFNLIPASGPTYGQMKAI